MGRVESVHELGEYTTDLWDKDDQTQSPSFLQHEEVKETRRKKQW